MRELKCSVSDLTLQEIPAYEPSETNLNVPSGTSDSWLKCLRHTILIAAGRPTLTSQRHISTFDLL